MDEFNDIINRAETIEAETIENTEDDKINKAADVFVTILLTVLQLIAAAVLVAVGLTAIPAFSFSLVLILKVFCFLIGVKFIIAGYHSKEL